jgi:tRNA A-37 threonylcarbamoyl transferase component Bud32/tetratricopeptide (TPR) repeat protein
MTASNTQKVLFDKKYCPVCYAIYEPSVLNCPVDGVSLCGHDNDPLLGKTFADRYEILSLVGVGGMSVVYRARHKLIGRVVAIKMMHSILQEDVLALERFKKEAQAASSLSHPNIITIYDFGVSAHGEPFLVMDFLDGENLRDLLWQERVLPYPRAVNIFLQICDGLGAAHENGIVHRDLKPANIMLLKQHMGRDLVKILDFGIAKFNRRAIESLRLTRQGQIFGSPIYMSPEQCQGKPHDARSDIYSLGCLMYEVLTGEPPFDAESVLETMNMHVSAKFEPITQRTPQLDIPDELCSIVEQCLAKDPLERPQSCQEIVTLMGMIPLRFSSGGQSSGKLRAQGFKKARVIFLGFDAKDMVIAVLLMVILAGLAFLFVWPGPEQDRGSNWNKIRLQLCLATKDDAMKNGDYALAERALFEARALASRIDDRQQRLEKVLQNMVDLYNVWDGHAAQLETANQAAVYVLTNRAFEDYHKALLTLDKFPRSLPPVLAVGSAMTLRMEGQIPNIISIVGRLQARACYDEAENLLQKTLALGRRILPVNSLALASLELKLGANMCHTRKLSLARTHLVEAVRIYRLWQVSKPCLLAASLSKLGELDVELGYFREARIELDEAMSLTCESDQGLVALIRRSYEELAKQTTRLGLYKQTFQ